MKTVVIFSGGMDSTVCLKEAIDKHGAGEVTALTFLYGQANEQEVDTAKYIARHWNVRIITLKIDFFHEITSSALLKNSNTDFIGTIGDNTNVFTVPNRNQLFITLAHTLAQCIGAGSVVVGCHAGAFDLDNKPAFIYALQKTLDAGNDTKVKIETPIIYSDKAAIYAKADQLGILEYIINETVSCYHGNMVLHEWGRGCGECPACKSRMKGWKEFNQERTRGGLY